MVEVSIWYAPVSTGLWCAVRLPLLLNSNWNLSKLNWSWAVPASGTNVEVTLQIRVDISQHGLCQVVFRGKRSSALCTVQCTPGQQSNTATLQPIYRLQLHVNSFFALSYRGRVDFRLLSPDSDSD